MLAATRKRADILLLIEKVLKHVFIVVFLSFVCDDLFITVIITDFIYKIFSAKNY
jgi:hypothetical protein